jgi:hypothetical protein
MGEEAVIAILLANSAVTSLVSNRIQGSNTGQLDVTPRIVVQQISEDDVTSLGGYSGLSTARVQVDCYADDKRTAKKVLGYAVIDALRDYSGTVNGITVQRIAKLDARDTAVDDELAADSNQFGYQIDFEVWYDG